MAGLRTLSGPKTRRKICSKKRTLEGNRVQMIKHHFFVLLVNLNLLAQNDIPLALNFAPLQLRVLQDVRDDVDRLGDVLPERLGVVDRLLARSVRVEVRAHILDLELERLLRAAVGALERHVLQKVRRAVRRVGFGAGPRVDPHAHRCCLRMRVRLGGYCQAIRERGDFGKRPWDVRREQSDMTRLHQR